MHIDFRFYPSSCCHKQHVFFNRNKVNQGEELVILPKATEEKQFEEIREKNRFKCKIPLDLFDNNLNIFQCFLDLDFTSWESHMLTSRLGTLYKRSRYKNKGFLRM